MRNKKRIEEILHKSKENGWVLEPDAKKIFSLAGIAVPKYNVAHTLDETVSIANKIGFPVVAKIVSTEIIHKTEYDGVAVGIASQDELETIFERFQALPGFAGMLIEEMVKGVELIVGAKNDTQFGPVVLLGIGGTGVEIYQDSSIRMAPLAHNDVSAMLDELQGKKLLYGYRGKPAADIEALARTLVIFSKIIMHIENSFESIDINPLFCNEGGCIAADARIILK